MSKILVTFFYLIYCDLKKYVYCIAKKMGTNASLIFTWHVYKVEECQKKVFSKLKCQLYERISKIQEIKIPHFPYNPTVGIEFLAYISIRQEKRCR